MIATLGSPATGQNLSGCQKDEVRIATQALRRAKDLTVKAASQVGDTSEYARWFGRYSDANAEVVRANLKGIVSAIRTGGVTLECIQTNGTGCTNGEYAWVYPHRPFNVHLCQAFFSLPPLEALRPGEQGSDDGTREGTMVHEISHFNPVARTDDYCYSRSACAQMAQDDIALAIDNADSYQYFTEDVTYYARQPLANKPPPVPSP